MRYITPRKSAEGLGSSHSGTEDHWKLTISAVALAILTPAFLFVVGSAIGLPRDGVIAHFGRPYPAIVTALFIVVGMLHFMRGTQSMILDYTRDTARKVAIIGTQILGWAIIAAALYALAKMALMG